VRFSYTFFLFNIFMKIFKNYLSKQIIKSKFISEKVSETLNNVIVIPSFNEPNIINTLNSINNCDKPNYAVEVIVVINSSENSNEQIKQQNIKTKKEVISWAKANNNDKIKYRYIFLDKIPNKKAGVGYARKTGMDEAVRRFSAINNYNGIITNFDADSLVKKNYLVEIEKLFFKKPKTNACSIYFEHPLTGNEHDELVYEKIIEYELYLRYYSLSLKYLGFPYYYHTVGSSFAVKAETYCKQGGMNTKKAGEDFYFLHKIMPLGNYEYLKSTSVYPSSRPSNRVPFGTGAMMTTLINEPEKPFLTYNFDVFRNLKLFFDIIDEFYRIESLNFDDFDIDKSVKQFLKENKFEKSIIEINSNTSNIKTFRKRFFAWFDAFKILKYLNFSHQNFIEKELINNAIKKYFKFVGIKNIDTDNSMNLLEELRKIEKDC